MEVQKLLKNMSVLITKDGRKQQNAAAAGSICTMGLLGLTHGTKERRSLTPGIGTRLGRKEQ